MEKDLERYNHLQYHNLPENESDGFIDFLHGNSINNAPDVDETEAWKRFKQQIHPEKNWQWLKIAAIIALVFTLSLSIYLISNQDPELVQVVSQDRGMNVTFPDGSIGILNRNSSFSFPEKFGAERKVSFKGEAYFDIVKSDKPFIIALEGVDVKVLGTAFNLKTTEKEIKLFVDRGSVAFLKGGKETKVKAGLEAIFDRSSSSVRIKEVPSENIMSWRNGYFEFDQTPLKDAIKQLSDYYNVDFNLSNEKLNDCRISIVIDNKTLPQALNLIESILNVKTHIRGKSVKISGKGC